MNTYKITFANGIAIEIRQGIWELPETIMKELSQHERLIVNGQAYNTKHIVSVEEMS